MEQIDIPSLDQKSRKLALGEPVAARNQEGLSTLTSHAITVFSPIRWLILFSTANSEGFEQILKRLQKPELGSSSSRPLEKEQASTWSTSNVPNH